MGDVALQAALNLQAKIGILNPLTTLLSCVITGNLEALKWARANGCPWDASTCRKAAAGRSHFQGQHFEVLKWAHANGCEWDVMCCAFAALLGDLEMLQWARENGCPWDVWTCNFAAQGKGLLSIICVIIVYGMCYFRFTLL